MKRILRLVALAAVLAGVATAWFWRGALHPAAIRDLMGHSEWAPALFIALQIAASLFFVPRTVLGLAAGLLFGLVWGSIWAMTGALAGAAAGFALVRWLGAAGALDHSPKIGRLIEQAERGGWRAVTIARLMPLPHSLVNTALAATNVSWRDYLVGSALGMLPATLAQVAIGASGEEMLTHSGNWLLASLLLAAGLALSFLIKRAAPSGN